MTRIITRIGLVALLFATACGPGASLAQPSPTVRFTPEPTATPRPTLAPTPSPALDWSKVPAVAEDPGGVAQQLAAAEAAIHDPNVTGAQLTWYGHFAQLLVSTINDNPAWKDQVLEALPVMMNLLKFYQEGEQTFGVPWYHLAAINLVETRMGRIRGLSYAGAQGPMQFMAPTWAAYGQGDVNDPRDAILGAARYLKASGAPANTNRALFAYNHSDAYVNAIAGYAEVMKNDPDAFRGYHGWQVYYSTVDGTSWLRPGWTKEP